MSIVDPERVKHYNLNPQGYVQMTTMTVSAGLSSIPASAKRALLTAEVAPVRWRDDGTSPTATSGQLIAVGAPPFKYTGRLNAMQVIQASAGAVLNVSYYD